MPKAASNQKIFRVLLHIKYNNDIYIDFSAIITTMIAIMTPGDVFQEFSKRMRQQRIDKNMTQAELAQRSGVSVAVLSKFEQTGKISLESFIKLAFILGLTEKLLSALQLQTEFNSMDELLKTSEKKNQKMTRNLRYRKGSRSND